MKQESDAFLTWGLVAGTRGLRGELKVRFIGPDGPDLRLRSLTLWFRKPGEADSVPHRVDGEEPYRQGLLLRLDKVGTQEAAQALVGCEVSVRTADLPVLPEGRPYWFQMEGIEVWDRHHGAIGRLKDLFTTAAHPIYVVAGPFGEVLIPAVEKFILEVDLDRRRMDVDLPAGLVPEPDEI